VHANTLTPPVQSDVVTPQAAPPAMAGVGMLLS
jgi:hypothetical protein